MSLVNLNYCNETLALKTRIELGFIQLGERLKNIRDNRLFEEQWETFEEYLMEFRNISEGMASRLISIYERLILEYKIPVKVIAEAGGWSVIAETLPLMTNKKKALYWLHEASTHPRSLLRKNITEAKRGVDMAKCKHTDTYTIKVCRGCDERTSV